MNAIIVFILIGMLVMGTIIAIEEQSISGALTGLLIGALCGFMIWWLFAMISLITPQETVNVQTYEAMHIEEQYVSKNNQIIYKTNSGKIKTISVEECKNIKFDNTITIPKVEIKTTKPKHTFWNWITEDVDNETQIQTIILPTIK